MLSPRSPDSESGFKVQGSVFLFCAHAFPTLSSLKSLPSLVHAVKSPLLENRNVQSENFLILPRATSAPLTVLPSRLTFISMAPEPAIEQFINNCFHDRTEALKSRLETHQAFWQRFYHSECLWDSRRGVIEKSQEEKVISISPFDVETLVITSGSIYRDRYHLKPSGRSWLIHEIDMECALCRGKAASSNCMLCDGSGWRSWKDQANSLRLKRAEHHRSLSRPESDSELYRRVGRNSDIEIFMIGHFRERSVSLRKETEIYAKFVDRYFSAEFDSSRWLTSVHDSDAEDILAMAPAKNGTHVYTTGCAALQLRYNVRSTGQSWLIWQVNHECPMCVRQGRRADCFFCGGTIWEQKLAHPGGNRSTPPGEEPPGYSTRW